MRSNLCPSKNIPHSWPAVDLRKAYCGQWMLSYNVDNAFLNSRYFEDYENVKQLNLGISSLSFPFLKYLSVSQSLVFHWGWIHNNGLVQLHSNYQCIIHMYCVHMIYTHMHHSTGATTGLWNTCIDCLKWHRDWYLWPLLLTWFNFNPSMDK